jgi:hypothetical protein
MEYIIDFLILDILIISGKNIFKIILLLICLYIEAVMIAKVDDFRSQQSFDPNSF